MNDAVPDSSVLWLPVTPALGPAVTSKWTSKSAIGDEFSVRVAVAVCVSPTLTTAVGGDSASAIVVGAGIHQADAPVADTSSPSTVAVALNKSEPTHALEYEMVALPSESVTADLVMPPFGPEVTMNSTSTPSTGAVSDVRCAVMDAVVPTVTGCQEGSSVIWELVKVTPPMRTARTALAKSPLSRRLPARTR